jgi:hypothetical protein
MLWERVEPPYHWKTTGLYIVADRHLNDGTRQHMVEGHVEPGCVRAGAQVVGRADIPDAEYSDQLSHLSEPVADKDQHD